MSLYCAARKSVPHFVLLGGRVEMDAAFYFPSVDATPAVTKIREGAITKIRESATNGYQLLPHPQLL